MRHRSPVKLYYHLLAQIVEALGDVFVHGYYVDKVIAHRFRDHPKWGARDRRQFAESLYELVRWWRWYWYLAGLPDEEYLQPESITRARAWLVFGTYWAAKTNVVPPFEECRELNLATINEREETIVAPAIRASVPDWLNQLGKRELGDEWPDMLRALNRPADVFLRANTRKIQAKPLAINLAKEEIETLLVPDLPDGLQLVRRQNVFQSSAFRSGLFEVQDGASQMIAPFLQVEPGMKVVDACAGAGGKALHLACLMKNQGIVIALDVLQWKLDELRKRFRRNEITIIEPRVIQGSKTINGLVRKADRVLLDVPCSGLGVLRRNPDSKWKLTVDEVQRLRGVQAEILRDYSRMVKPGGKLVYSTCSVLPSENELQIKAFLKEHGDEWELEEERTWMPNRNGFDGFYAARLLRKATSGDAPKEAAAAKPAKAGDKRKASSTPKQQATPDADAPPPVRYADADQTASDESQTTGEW